MAHHPNSDGLAAARPDLTDAVYSMGIAPTPPAAGASMPRGISSYRRDDTDTLLPDDTEIPTAEIEEALGEPFSHTLDVTSWDRGLTSAALEKLEEQIADAVRQERGIMAMVRREIFPQIEQGAVDLPSAGVYQATVSEIEHVQRDVLFNGGTTAVDGTVRTHDTLPITITQIGASRVTYAGEQGTWTHRVYRRELRAKGPEVKAEELLDLLQKRRGRGGLGQPDRGKKEGRLSELLGRGLMSFSERLILADLADTPWRMGHGTPAPYELLTGSGNMDLLRAGLDAIRRLVLDHRRFVFVPSADGDRFLLTLGLALRPLEFAVVHTDHQRMRPIIMGGNLRENGGHLQFARMFLRDVGPQIAVGVYRTYADAPPQVFYAHSHHAHEAALVAMADSILQPHRGFPTLIDVADIACKAYCGMDAFEPSIQAGYTRSGSPLQFLAERATRD